jgi:hypothetical protein
MLGNAANIRTQARRLQAAAEKLLEAADILDGGEQNTPLLASTLGNQLSSDEAEIAPSRREQIIHLLQAQGPMRSKDIMDRTGIPRGTIGFVLRDKDTFDQDNMERWFLKKDLSS